MNLKLHIIKREELPHYSFSEQHSLCIAVVDLNKSETYPLNFVCTLPVQIKKIKKQNAFEKIFSERSIEQAKILLNDALNTTEDSEVRDELERRLKLIEPKNISQIKCSDCGKLFLPRRKRRFRNNFCEDCIKKKFGSRE